MLEVISTRRSAVRIAALLGATSIAFTSAAEMSTEEMRSLMEGVYSLQEWRQDGKVLTPPTVDGRTVHIDGSIVFIIHRGEGDEKLTVAQFGNYTFDGSVYSYGYQNCVRLLESPSGVKVTRNCPWTGMRSFVVTADGDLVHMRSTGGQEFRISKDNMTYSDGKVTRVWRRERK